MKRFIIIISIVFVLLSIIACFAKNNYNLDDFPLIPTHGDKDEQ